MSSALDVFMNEIKRRASIVAKIEACTDDTQHAALVTELLADTISLVPLANRVRAEQPSGTWVVLNKE